MNSQNNLARWTKPTTPNEIGFFSQYSGAITRYAIGLWVVQVIMVLFSVKPAIALLGAKLVFVPALLPYVPVIALVGLCFLHYVLHGEILETLSNILDGDKETNNNILNWAAPVLIFFALLSLDIIGMPITLRDTSFAAKKQKNKADASSELSEIKADYAQSLANIAQTRRDDSASAVAPFLREKALAAKIKTYDAADERSKASKLSDIEHRKALALAEVRKTAADEIRKAQNAYSTEKSRIVGKRETAETGLANADEADEANAQSKGWIISIFLYLLFVVMAYKLVLLRVGSGIRINVKFTELDAQGGFFEKIRVATLDIFKRQGQRFVVVYHRLGTKGTSTLYDLDGTVILRESSYNSPDSVLKATPSVQGGSSDLLDGFNPQSPTPPTGGGSDGGDGGGFNPPTPSPTPAPTKAVEISLVRTEKYNSLTNADLRFRIANSHRPPFTQAIWQESLEGIDPQVNYWSNGTADLDASDLEKVCKLATHYSKPSREPATLPNGRPNIKVDTRKFKSYRFNDQDFEVQKEIARKTAEIWGIEPLQASYLLEKVNAKYMWDNDGITLSEESEKEIQVMLLSPTPEAPEAMSLASMLSKEPFTDVPPTPSVPAPISVENENPVTQPIPTVSQSYGKNVVSELDDKLEMLRKKILENSESQFKRGDTNNQTIAKRIFSYCDTAFLALKKGGEVSENSLNRFKTAAMDRLDLSAAYGFTYDSRQDLMMLLERKEVGNNE